MKKRKKKALAELEDIHESLLALIIQTSPPSRCGIECAFHEVKNQIETIRKGITKRKVKTKFFTIEGIVEKFFAEKIKEKNP